MLQAFEARPFSSEDNGSYRNSGPLLFVYWDALIRDSDYNKRFAIFKIIGLNSLLKPSHLH
jgi:hypothetical protein